MSKETLWELFLNSEVGDLQTILLMGGINNLMENFTLWLYENELINIKNINDVRDYVEEKKENQGKR